MEEFDIARAFSDAMERGDSKADDEVAELRRAMYKQFNQYLDAVERHYFEWGYREGIAHQEK